MAKREDLLSSIEQLLKHIRGVLVDEEGKPETPEPKPLTDLPGFRTVKTYKTSIEYLDRIQARRTGVIIIDPDGPFIITQLQVYWRQGTQDRDGFNQGGAGLVVAPTIFAAAKDLTNAATTAASYSRNFHALSGPIVQVTPEFDFELQTSGDGRMWTGQTPIPAAAFYGFGSGPLYLGVQGWVNPRERLLIHANPQILTPMAGTIEVVASGFQIINPRLRVTMPLNWLG